MTALASITQRPRSPKIETDPCCICVDYPHANQPRLVAASPIKTHFQLVLQQSSPDLPKHIRQFRTSKKGSIFTVKEMHFLVTMVLKKALARFTTIEKKNVQLKQTCHISIEGPFQKCGIYARNNIWSWMLGDEEKPSRESNEDK